MFSNSSPANYVPIVNQPFLYMTGFQISNNAVTPNSLLNVGVGQCRDSTDTYDISMSSPIVINSAVNGLNGLDTGTIEDSSIYAVLVLYNSNSGISTGGMITLNPKTPLLPYGYSVYRVIGYVTTDSSGDFYLGQWTAGGTGHRMFAYDNPPSVLSGGSATVYTAVDLSAYVPGGIAQIPVNIYYSYTPFSASAQHALTLQGVNGSSGGFSVPITGQVSSQAQTNTVQIIAELNASASNKVEINYKATADDLTSLWLAGYTLNL